ncbi:thiamine-phosphate kinase [Zoogloeaceae bacterium G21618-S1]|nr:thiamine-phosphate kinase [Zoogloeaceae bacterium G21618-S1]
MTSEFDLIRRHFTRPTRHTDLAGGDDAALWQTTPGHQMVVSTDMLVEGRHFFADADPADLGWKSLAVNVSDIAAMGATPRWALLALALPDADADWLTGFADGFYACAEAFDVDLVGGDTTRGPRNLSVTICGEVPTGTAIRRDGAHAGDDLWISGQPGRAALALWHLRDQLPLDPAHRDTCLAALLRPQPRVALGLALRGVASAMLDVSDGLLGDLGHLLDASAVGARISATQLPEAALITACGDAARARQACLSGGDDYELLFAAPAAQRNTIARLSASLALPLHHIGSLTPPSDGLTLLAADGTRTPLTRRGFDHFSA